MIKDSGNRQQFYSPTGEEIAVRDAQEGKGYYTSLPWNAIDDLARHCERGIKNTETTFVRDFLNQY